MKIHSGNDSVFCGDKRKIRRSTSLEETVTCPRCLKRIEKSLTEEILLRVKDV